jgi:hypothetical protein
VLDAHFARSSQVVYDYCKEGLILYTRFFYPTDSMYNHYLTGNDVVTPRQLVTALRSYGGLENCVVELISLKREGLNMLRQACSSLEKKVKRFIGRTNDILFSYSDTFPRDSASSFPAGAKEFKKIPNYSFVAFEFYSGRHIHSVYDNNRR